MSMSQKSEKYVIAAVAVFAVALLITSAMATDPPEPEVGEVSHQYYVVYQPNGASTGSSITAGYDGIISTEYNPEHWYDEDKQSLPKSTPGNLPDYSSGVYDNWVGPSYTATGTLRMLLTVVKDTSYTISVPSTYDIAAEKESWMVSAPTIVNTGDTHTITFTTLDSAEGAGNKDYSISLKFTANKVFGGWAVANDSAERRVVRTADGSIETWTYYNGEDPYYREICDRTDAENPVWNFQSYSGGWSDCAKSSDLYFLKSGSNYYIPQYAEVGALYTDTFKKTDDWTSAAADKEHEDIGEGNYRDQFGNIWHKNGEDDYTLVEYKVYRERQYIPGDVIPATTKALVTKWIEPDVYTKRQTVSSWTNNAKSFTADADMPHTYLLLVPNGTTDPGLTSSSYSGTTVTQTKNSVKYEVRYGDGRTAPSIYGSNYLLSAGTEYNLGEKKGMPAGTYRSIDTSNKATFKEDYVATISGNAIIDNVKVRGNGNPGATHAAGVKGLYAMGKILIMGVGLESTNDFIANGNTYRDFQVYGGINTGTLTTQIDADLSTPEIDDKLMIFANSEDNVSVKAATCLVIFSGSYYNIIAGNNSGSIGTSGESGIKRSTYMVMKGGEVGDTVVGGSSSANTNIYSHVNSSDYNKRAEGTFAYFTGAFMPGDDWVDKQTGDLEEGSQRKANFKMVDVSVINGSCTKGNLWGTSHVFITDHASVYDVTAAGREKTSFTRFSYLEVSGTATVRHAACGGVMNGMGELKQLVDNTYVSIQGNCKVANVYGAGYDIYDAPTKSSMYNGGNITIEMTGGTVANVYGGGYRGQIGNSANYDALTISINISGGHVLDSVYGGGSGGVDKAKHYNDGTRYNDKAPGFGDSAGKSYVYGNIYVTVSGDTVIDGSVYGGGKSVSALKSYKGYGTTFSASSDNPVALTYGTTNVNIEGGTIGGSVYGGGRGAEWEYDQEKKVFVISDTTRTVLMKSNGALNIIDWFENSGTAPIVFYEFISIENGKYKGGYLDYAKLTGDAFVKITGGDIGGSVYGGGSKGRIESVVTGTNYFRGSSTVEITGGRIAENVFGGGLGVEGIVAVAGNRTVLINMATANMNSENPADIIYGSVYGGSSIGDDGPFNGVNKIDVKETGKIENGFPNSESKYQDYLSKTSQSNSSVVITQALIGNPYNGGLGNSVFGGGFMGKTYGYTNVYIGYDYERKYDEHGAYIDGFTPTPHTGGVKTIFMNSIYAGGDISIEENSSNVKPFDETNPLVLGGGSVRIYGNGSNGDMTIVGCVMGSGNSCVTKWSTSATIDSLINKGKMTGIHRVDSLMITQSNLDILSRSTVTEVAGSPSKDLSLFMIDDLVLKYDTTITISAPMDYISNFRSLSKDSNPTTITSPSNRLVYTTGATLYVRDSNLQYGMVEGYTVLEAHGQGDFGAYVIGNLLSSTGGFVVAKEGTYKEADYSNMGNDIKCWFIAGTQNKVVTMNMAYDKNQSRAAIPASIDIMKMQSDTKIRYAGATFTTISTDNSGNSFEFVRPGTEDESYKFGMIIGYRGDSHEDNLIYADTERYLSIAGRSPAWVSGTYYSDDPAESRGSYEPMRDEESSSARTLVPLAPVDMINEGRNTGAGAYKLNLLFTGVPEDTTMYVGYIIISLQEVDEVTYEAMDEHGNLVIRSNTMVTNNINIRADMYVIGSGDVWEQSSYKVVLKADEDTETGLYSGYSEIIIPTGFVMGRLALDSVTTENVPAFESIKIAAVINQDSTTGWMTVNSPVTWTQNGDNQDNQPIGTMSGTIVATIRYSIEGFNYPDLEDDQYPVFHLHFKTTDKNNQKVASDVSVTIKPKPMHTVTYINEYGATTYGHYSDGAYLSPSMFSNMGANFIGWYFDSDFNNMFDYKMPITKNMTLYARFSFVVTFDNMNGTSSKMYIASSTGGAQLSEKNVPKPTYTGYEFKGWYKDTDGIVPWDYAYDSVTGDVTLYAKWVGVEVRVNFLYYKDGNWLLYRGGGPNLVSGVPAEVPPEVTDAECVVTIDDDTLLDLFGNHYTKDGMVYTMDVKSLYGPGEREYKYVVSEDKYYVYIGSEWIEVTDESYIGELADLKGFSFKNRFADSPLTYYKKIDSDSYRKIYGTLVRPVITDDRDQFGNHYTAGVMDWAVVWTSDIASGMYKLTFADGKFYRNTGTVKDPVWNNVAEETGPDTYYLRDRYTEDYDVDDNFASSARYLMAESGFFALLSDWRVISPLIDTSALKDQFGNVYERIGERAPYTYNITEYHFYRTELQLKYVISEDRYYEWVGTESGWISYDAASGLYHKDTYGYHYKHDDVNSKYVTTYLPSGAGNLQYPDSYVMGWFDGAPYYPTVRYGSTFNTIDPTLSTSVTPVNILDCAQEGVQALLGDDKFIRWQAYNENDPSSISSFGVYSDTVLSSGMADLSDLGWQSGMPEINLYAVTAKVAINLIMDKNVSDASASVAAPNTFLVYPMPNYIYDTHEQFDHDCDSVVEVENREKYTDGESGFFYKVKNQTNQYVTEDGRVLYTYDETYGYYGMMDLNYFEVTSDYNDSEESTYYKDRYGNIYKDGKTAADLIERRIYTENPEGVKYKIDAATHAFQIWDGEEWQNCSPVSNYYFVDDEGRRYVKIDENLYRMIDWDAVEFGYTLVSGDIYEDDIGLHTKWQKVDDTYTIQSCDVVYLEGSEPGHEYKATRAVNPLTVGLETVYEVIWIYQETTDGGSNWTNCYREFYNPLISAWIYSEWDGDEWVPCNKNNDFYLKDSLNNKYTKFDDDQFGKHEWSVKEAVITAGVDQFGNGYVDGELSYSIVYLFENEYKVRKDVVSASETDWIFYLEFGREETEAYKQVNIMETPGSGETLHLNDKTYEWTGSAWAAEETFRETYIQYSNGNTYREIQRKIAIPPAEAQWLPVYTESYDASTQKWTYWLRSGEYTSTPYVVFYYKDNYNNHYYSIDNVEYTCVSGSDTYYSFSFKLNEATRNGYKLSGWHNTHVNIDDALYPTSGIYRTIKLFYNEENGKTLINKEVLETTDVLGLPVRFINVDYDEYEAENPEYSYSSYHGKSLPRLDDAMKTYNITYLAQWVPITYTVTITQPAVGHIDAFLVSSNGDRKPIGEVAETKYGDRIELSYSAAGVYQFNRWIATGEFRIEDSGSASTTLVVNGNCSVSVSEIGERLVTLTVRFDAGALKEADREHVSVWMENNLTEEKYRLQLVDQPNNYELYRAYIPLNSNDPNEEYTVFVKYDDEVYYLKSVPGELRITKDSDTDVTFDLISARIRQSILIKDDEGRIVSMYSTINGTRLTQDMQTQLKIEDRVVVSVTRYVGASAEFLENNRDIINNPYNGIPPVKIFIQPGFDYLTLEGFPDEDEYGNYWFNINEDYNYHRGHSYDVVEKHFDLNWTRTDAPAEIIVQIVSNDAPGYEIKYTVGNPGEDPDLEELIYNGARLEADDSLQDKIGLAAASMASTLSGKSLSIQGWYYDKDLTKAVDYGTVIDEASVSMLELNKDNIGYHLYAKVVDTDKMATINVDIYQQNADGTWSKTVDHVPLNIVKDTGPYTGIIDLDTIAGFYMERNGVYAPAYTDLPAGAEGAGSFNIIDNTVVSYSPSVTYGGVTKTGGVLSLYYARNTVTLQINKTSQETYVEGAWADDRVEVLVGATQALPVLSRGTLTVSGWTASPTFSPSHISEVSANHFAYTVGMEETGTVYLTAQYNFVKPVDVTFITSKGYYAENLQSRITVTLEKGSTLAALPELVLPEGYSLHGLQPYPGYDVGMVFTENVSFTANLVIVQHNFTFRADNNEHSEVSATNDSSVHLLNVGSYNSLEHHSEISITVKPTKGRTIAINETKDWAYIKQDNGLPVDPIYTELGSEVLGATWRDQFYNGYTKVAESYNLVYSLIWVYKTTNDKGHTDMQYDSYIIMASDGKYYKNTGTYLAPVCGDECDKITTYYYKDGGISGNDYVKSGSQFQRRDWVPFTALGTPVKLSDDRGYIWSFFLDDDIDMVIHTTEVSVNINFVVNGELIDGKPGENMKVWGLSGTPKEDEYYIFGNNIPMYSKVEFYGYSNDPSPGRHYSDVYWYRDRACTVEYPYTIVDGHHKYEYLATEDLTVYAVRGKVSVNMYNVDGTAYRSYLLDRDNTDHITLPELRYLLEDHIFVGWGMKNNSGENEFKYGPGAYIDPAESRLDLYAYYLKGGTDQKVSYNGDVHTVEIAEDTDHGQAIGDTLHIRYSASEPIGSLAEGVSVLEFEDYVETTVYYYGELTSARSGYVSRFSGSFSFAITKVELYIIAPSANFAESYDNEGNPIVHTVSSESIQMIATTPDGRVPNPEDITAVVLDTNMWGYSDRIAGVGSVRTAASIFFAEGKADNYIIHYVDGSLVVYPLESARYMYGGF